MEGGPGPASDGTSAQWGGDQHYDVVMWNLPYLPRPSSDADVLGPMEESALIDTDDKGLFVRYVKRISNGHLLKEKGIALAVVSSLLDGSNACSIAWRHGLAARVLATETFDDGESLDLIGIWHPYAGVQTIHESVVTSTNTLLLDSDYPVGVRCTSDKQLNGRGRRGRSWQSLEGSVAASWIVDDKAHALHQPADQVHLGFNMLQLFQHHDPDGICMKWPNDLYVRTSNSPSWKKCAGILFEGRTRGKGQRTVLGIGLNKHHSTDSNFSSLEQFNSELATEDIVAQIHAIVASMFEVFQQPLVPFSSPQYDSIDSAIIAGSKHLGPLFYRGSKVEVVGVDKDGSLIVLDDVGESFHIDEPEEIEWSNIKFGI